MKTRTFLRRHAWWLIAVVAIDAVLVLTYLRHRHAIRAPAMPSPQPAAPMQPVASELQMLAYPTRQTRLTDVNLAGVYQPTVSGDPVSGTYGSVRTGQEGKHLVPRFHEGVDIAALERDRNGRPLDDVYAAASGIVALANRVPGNSDYGQYVVLTHQDLVGVVYTLYGHLAEIDPSAREGAALSVGARLGRMGNTALEPIPMARAHLHFEIGLINNAQFLSWPGRRKQQTPGGVYNGQNLLGISPILVFRDREATGHFTLLDHLRRLPVAWEMALATSRLPDFFERYSALWQGEPYAGSAIAIGLTEGGVPVWGRNATPAERSLLGRSRVKVLQVDPEVLGRNGRRIIVQRSGDWILGVNGETWVDIFLHHP